MPCSPLNDRQLFIFTLDWKQLHKSFFVEKKSKLCFWEKQPERFIITFNPSYSGFLVHRLKKLKRPFIMNLRKWVKIKRAFVAFIFEVNVLCIKRSYCIYEVILFQLLAAKEEASESFETCSEKAKEEVLFTLFFLIVHQKNKEERNNEKSSDSSSYLKVARKLAYETSNLDFCFKNFPSKQRWVIKSM